MRVFFMKKSNAIRIVLFAVIMICAVAYADAGMDLPAFNEAADGPICSVETEERVVAITFDTTFGTDYTSEILDILKKHKAKATFAVMGAWAEQNYELVKQINSAGHEIISHSMNHGRYPDMTAESIVRDADEARSLLMEITGKETYLIRAPYGAYDETVLSALRSKGYVPIMWSVDSKDWEATDPQQIVGTVLAKLESGGIVLFQNNSEHSKTALEEILSALDEREYKTVTVSELFTDGKITVNSKRTS